MQINKPIMANTKLILKYACVFFTANECLLNFNFGVDCIQEIIQFSTPGNCSIKQYFDTDSLKCSACRPGFIKSSDGLSCRCPSPNIFSQPLGSPPTCQQCQATELASSDHNVCVPKRCFKNANGKTSCFICKKNQIIVTHHANNSMIAAIECVTCSPGSTPSPDKSRCKPCHLRSAGSLVDACDCNEKTHSKVQDLCVPSAFIRNLTVYQTKTSKGEDFRSSFFEKHWISSNYLCSLNNSTACQMVANMCVMSMYSNAENSPCAKWRNHKDTVRPSLMYGEDESYSVLWRKKIPLTFSLGEKSEYNKLDIVAVGYYPDGNFRSPVYLSPGVFLPCPTVWKNTKTHLFKFAVNYRHSCIVGAQQLIAQSETIFYEPYLRYVDRDKDGKATGSSLYAIPVLIRSSLIDFNKESDINTWQLVRRFFMFDKTSGAVETPNGGGVTNLKYFRYVKRIEVKIRIRRKGKDERNKIYPPLVVLDYAELSEADMQDDVDVSSELLVRFELDGGGMMHGMEIAVGSLSAMGAVYSILQSWSRCRRAGKLGLDLYTLAHFCIIVAGNLANTFFIVSFGASAYSFLLYKTQKTVYAVPPSEKDESVIHSYIIVAFSLKIVEMLSVNWRQINTDVCFIDWDRPSQPRDEVGLKLPSMRSDAPVSFWRSYFVANEWNEIQTLRKISLPLHLVSCVFVLEIFGVSDWSNVGMETVADQSMKSLSSPAYQVALGAMVFLLLYFLQLGLAIFVYERFITNAIQDFMDICSIGNVSMLLLDAKLHGYYLHGRCVHASCDADARGLQPGLPHRAFSLRCTPDFRMYYDRLSIHMAAKDMKWQWQHHMAAGRDTIGSPTVTGRQSGRMSSGKGSRRGEEATRVSAAASSLPPALEQREQAARRVNSFLTALFDHALEDLDYEVREKRIVERLLDVELVSEIGNRSLLLYNETGDPQSFQRAIWYGQEWTLATFDLYLFCFVQLLSGSFVLAALITAVVWKVFAILRQFAGKKNLAKKTLIDERFLI